MPPITLTNGLVVTQQPDGTYKDADGKTYSAAAIAPFMPKQDKALVPDPTDPYDPTHGSGDARVALLESAGYRWAPENPPGVFGPNSLWITPEGGRTSEVAALARVQAEGARAPAATQSPDTRYLPDGTYQEWNGKTWVTDPAMFNPAKAAGYQAPRQAPTARFGFEQIGGRVFRTNDLTGALEDTGISAPGFTNVEVDRSGNLVGIDQNGQYQVIQPGFGFAGIDPERGQAVEEAGVTGYFGGRPTYEREQADRTYGFNQAGAAEAAGLDRATLAENARQANLQSATSAFGDVVRTAPQFGDLALRNAEFTKATLRDAPDYVARAYFQQGKTSPLPQVGMPDIINYLRSNISDYNSTIQGFNPQVGAYTPPPAYAPPPAFRPAQAVTAAPSPAPAAPSQPVAGLMGGGAAYIGGGNPEAEAVARKAFAPGGAFGFTAAEAPRFASGGMTDANMVITGDSRSGKPTGFEELVTDLPNDQGMMVQPLNDMPRMAEGGMTEPSAMDGMAEMGAMMKMMADSKMSPSMMKEMPEVLPKMVEMAKQMDRDAAAEKPKMGKHKQMHRMPDGSMMQGSMESMAKSAPRAASGGLFGFNLPNLPGVQGPSTQSEIQALERSVRPPAIDTILSGGVAQSPRFGFSLFTPQQMSSLTPDDRSALGTTLATQFNETVPNVDFAIQQRFGPTGQRNRARQLAGFAS